MNAIEYVTAPSRSRSKVVHTITVFGGTPGACTCEVWKFGILKTQPLVCAHMTELWATLIHKANSAEHLNTCHECGGDNDSLCPDCAYEATIDVALNWGSLYR